MQGLHSQTIHTFQDLLNIVLGVICMGRGWKEGEELRYH